MGIEFLAGIVTFNPDIDRLKENIEAISDQVNQVVIIDNASNNLSDIRELLLFYPNIVLVTNDFNYGIAKALNQIMQYAVKYRFDWALSLDQDSVCMEHLIATYKQYIDREDVGMMTCNVVDRNFNLNGIAEKSNEEQEIKDCITSASLIRTEAFKETDGYDEKMFIDSVDFDMCYQLRKSGYKIIRVAYDGVLHEVGHGKNVSLFGKQYVVYNHGPQRQYYMARNQLYLARKHPQELNRWQEYIREVRAQMLVLLYENNKWAKLKARWRGILDARKM